MSNRGVFDRNGGGQQVPLNVPLLGQNQRVVRVQPAHAAMPGSLAAPVLWPQVLTDPNGQMAVLTFGGLTKVEQLAGMIAGHLTANGVLTASFANEGEFDAAVARCAVNIADAILTECANRDQPRDETGSQPEQPTT